MARAMENGDRAVRCMECHDTHYPTHPCTLHATPDTYIQGRPRRQSSGVPPAASPVLWRGGTGPVRRALPGRGPLTPRSWRHHTPPRTLTRASTAERTAGTVGMRPSFDTLHSSSGRPLPSAAVRLSARPGPDTTLLPRLCPAGPSHPRERSSLSGTTRRAGVLSTQHHPTTCQLHPRRRATQSPLAPVVPGRRFGSVAPSAAVAGGGAAPPARRPVRVF